VHDSLKILSTVSGREGLINGKSFLYVLL
jgi:hypothetical protein